MDKALQIAKISYYAIAAIGGLISTAWCVAFYAACAKGSIKEETNETSMESC